MVAPSHGFLVHTTTMPSKRWLISNRICSQDGDFCTQVRSKWQKDCPDRPPSNLHVRKKMYLGTASPVERRTSVLARYIIVTDTKKLDVRYMTGRGSASVYERIADFALSGRDQSSQILQHAGHERPMPPARSGPRIQSCMVMNHATKQL
jgi:hypothetical protein